MLLPSQAVKAIDRQRRDLVAYEYLCHLAECVPQLSGSPIRTARARLTSDFDIPQGAKLARGAHHDPSGSVAAALGGFDHRLREELAGRLCARSPRSKSRRPVLSGSDLQRAFGTSHPTALFADLTNVNFRRTIGAFAGYSAHRQHQHLFQPPERDWPARGDLGLPIRHERRRADRPRFCRSFGSSRSTFTTARTFRRSSTASTRSRICSLVVDSLKASTTSPVRSTLPVRSLRFLWVPL